MSQAIVVLFGVLGSIVCLGSFLYAMWFVGNILTRKSGIAVREVEQSGSSIESPTLLDRGRRASDQPKRVCFARQACLSTPLDDGDCLEC